MPRPDERETAAGGPQLPPPEAEGAVTAVATLPAEPPPPVGPRGAPGWRRVLDYVSISLALLLILLPGLGLLLPLPGARVPTRAETRHPFPKLELKWRTLRAFPGRLNDFLETNLGFRALLIRAHTSYKIGWLHTSPSREITIGREGWLYLNSYHEDDCARHTRLFTPEELERWQQELEARRDWLAARGAEFLVVICPDKHTIYPEYLPGAAQPVTSQSRLSQLTEYLQAHSDLAFVDPTQALREAKPERQLYYRLDSHWNAAGALVAFREVARRLHAWYPRVEVPESHAYRVSRGRAVQRDFADMLGLPPADITEFAVCVDPPQPWQARVTFLSSSRGQQGNAVLDRITTECDGAPIPRVVILRDSFGTALLPFLAEEFGRATFLWTGDFDRKELAEERPDVVIWELVERDLYLAPQPMKH